MTREIMDQQLPQNIIRKTVEPLSGDSLKRYQEITDIMVNKYNYNLVSVEKNKWGDTIWHLTKNEINNKNKDMKESYEITHTYSTQERMKKNFDWVLPLLPKD